MDTEGEDAGQLVHPTPALSLIKPPGKPGGGRFFGMTTVHTGVLIAYMLERNASLQCYTPSQLLK
jgi:hypothetical protein